MYLKGQIVGQCLNIRVWPQSKLRETTGRVRRYKFQCLMKSWPSNGSQPNGSQHIECNAMFGYMADGTHPDDDMPVC